MQKNAIEPSGFRRCCWKVQKHHRIAGKRKGVYRSYRSVTCWRREDAGLQKRLSRMSYACSLGSLQGNVNRGIEKNTSSFPLASVHFGSNPFGSLPFWSGPVGSRRIASLVVCLEKTVRFGSLPVQSAPFHSVPISSAPLGSGRLRSRRIASIPLSTSAAWSVPSGIPAPAAWRIGRAESHPPASPAAAASASAHLAGPG